MSTRLRPIGWTLGLLLLATSAAWANPNIAPGLWEYRTAMKTSDPSMNKAMAEAQKALAGMAPEQRRQMEQMMASQGLGIGAAGPGGGTTSVRVCISPEQAAKQELPAPDPKCSSRVTGRSSNAIKFVIECPAEQMRGEGETVFSSPRAYEGRFTMQQTREGKAVQMESSIAAKWLAADCGAIKPVR